MNRHIAWLLTLVAGAWTVDSARGQLANPPASQKAASASQAKPMAPADKAAEEARQRAAFEKAAIAMNPILAEWEKRSAKITSLDAVFDMVEVSPGFGNQWYRGRAMLQTPDKACLEFKLYKVDDQKRPIVLADANGKKVAQLEKEPDRRIVCTGAEVIQYTWGSKTINVYPLDAQARRKALQEGPLPFLFNMKVAEARQRYTMWLQKEEEKQYIINIIPRMEIDRDNFTMATLKLSKTTFLPNELTLLKNGGKDKEEYKFDGPNDEVRANTAMNQKFFQFQMFTDWKVVVNKGDGAPAPGVGQAPAPVAQPKQQAAQPAGRSNPR
jgi:TIGR03009 family protein